MSNPAQSTLGSLPWDVLELVIGLSYNHGEKFYLGFVGLRDLRILSQTSSKMSELVQPMLALMKDWRRKVILNALQGTHDHPHDPLMFALLGPRTASPFHEAMNAAFKLKLWTVPMTSADHTALVALIKEHPTFNHDQKAILKGLLPNATPHDIFWAANGLGRLGSQYHARAAAFYERSADHPDAKPHYIFWAADGLRRLGLTKRAAARYEQLANHSDATPTDIQMAADGLNDLGFTERAKALFKRLTALPGETARDMGFTAYGFEKLRSMYPEESAERTDHYTNAVANYKKMADHKNATVHNIQCAANGLDRLGLTEKAALLYEKSTDHKNATPNDFLSAGHGLSNLGSDYDDRAAVLYEKLANHPKATPDNIQDAAHGFRRLGSAYYSRADALLSRLPG